MKRVVVLGLAASLVFAACAKQTTVDDVANKMTQTLGGAEKLATMQDQVSNWTSKVTMAMGDSMMTMNGTMTITYKSPNKLKFEGKDSHGQTGFISVFDGTNGWIYAVGPDGMPHLRDMTPAEIQEATVTAETWADGWHDYAAKGFKLTMLGDTTINGKTYHRIQATDRFGNTAINYCDTQTGLVEQTEAEVSDPMSGQKAPSVMTFTGYAAHDGFMVPGKYTQRDTQGLATTEAVLTDVKHNTGVTDDAFAKPVPPAMSAEHPQEHPTDKK